MTDPRTQATRTQMDTGGIGGRVPTGWAAFAGIMLVIVGTFNFIWGLTALFNDEALTVGEQVTVLAQDRARAEEDARGERVSPFEQARGPRFALAAPAQRPRAADERRGEQREQ